jgi:PTS system maltose and glucose-specific IIC component
VIAGIIVWMLHERFHNIRLPDALAFFGGTRFVPIITTVVLGLVGLVIPSSGRSLPWGSTPSVT